MIYFNGLKKNLDRIKVSSHKRLDCWKSWKSHLPINCMVAPRRLKRWGNTLLLCTSGGLSVQHWQQQSNQLHIAPLWRTQICVQQGNTAVTKCWAIHILEMTVLVVWREENLRNIQVTSKSHPSHVTWLIVCFLFFFCTPYCTPIKIPLFTK